jgi:hypothetical protein
VVHAEELCLSYIKYNFTRLLAFTIILIKCFTASRKHHLGLSFTAIGVLLSASNGNGATQRDMQYSYIGRPQMHSTTQPRKAFATGKAGSSERSAAQCCQNSGCVGKCGRGSTPNWSGQWFG